MCPICQRGVCLCLWEPEGRIETDGAARYNHSHWTQGYDYGAPCIDATQQAEAGP